MKPPLFVNFKLIFSRQKWLPDLSPTKCKPTVEKYVQFSQKIIK